MGNDSLAVIAPTETAIGPPSTTARRLVDASVSANTRQAYAGALGRLDAWLDGRQIDDAALAAYLAELHDAGRAARVVSSLGGAMASRRRTNGTGVRGDPACDAAGLRCARPAAAPRTPAAGRPARLPGVATVGRGYRGIRRLGVPYLACALTRRDATAIRARECPARTQKEARLKQ